MQYQSQKTYAIRAALDRLGLEEISVVELSEEIIELREEAEGRGTYLSDDVLRALREIEEEGEDGEDTNKEMWNAMYGREIG